jgi:hypothetical protein
MSRFAWSFLIIALVGSANDRESHGANLRVAQLFPSAA